MTGRTPWDEPTTISRDDLPAEPEVPHRHPDTDLRPMIGIVRAIAAALIIGGTAALIYGLTR